jgi:hypothetical protein
LCTIKERDERVNASNTQMAIEGVLMYMALQMKLAQGREGAIERAGSSYGLGYLLGIVDATCQHYLIEQESKDGIHISAKVFRAVFQNDALADQQFAASLGSQSDSEHQEGMIAGGEEMFRFLSGETLGILGLSAFLATGRKRRG